MATKAHIYSLKRKIILIPLLLRTDMRFGYFLCVSLRLLRSPTDSAPWSIRGECLQSPPTRCTSTAPPHDASVRSQQHSARTALDRNAKVSNLSYDSCS